VRDVFFPQGQQKVKLYLIPDAIVGLDQCHDVQMVCVEDSGEDEEEY
jgi:hypothetical protein